MAEIVRKSMRDLNLSIGGLDISSGGGENDFISTTAPERFGVKSGVHDDGVFFDMANSFYEVTITLLETAEANENMQELYTQQLQSSSQGPYDFQYEDVGTQEELSGQAMITKEPDRVKTAEAQNYEWTLQVFQPEGVKYRSRGTVLP